ncbi:hypothetical protein M378DRAFT_162295 [Amanita muscaria Koide BX008]|uniref:Uncharacterized protein n=1 Tax=Amanita muscaria (strain Koide BX008) TaxID=946122 RepID=A0A0C2TES4_AMAMK|nr:hypothetical protein M378DRAFT_162295 [Amanita muscaria Koide BX008]
MGGLVLGSRLEAHLDCPRQGLKGMSHAPCTSSSGLCDESDITVRGITAIRRCFRVYLEVYTSIRWSSNPVVPQTTRPS